MYRSAANPLIRVAVFPVILLFWQFVFGTDLPLLAPAMCAVFLTTTHEPPPLIMVVIMGGILMVTAWFQVVMASLLANYIHVYYLLLFGVFYWCMERTKANAQDVFAILLIVATAMIAVFTQQMGIDVASVPMALLVNIGIAGFTAYLAYFLFPGGEPLAKQTSPATPQPVHLMDWQTMLKTVTIMVVLLVTTSLELEQSTIITIVVALILKDPDPVVGHDYGVRRLLTTFASVLYAVPPLVMSVLQANLAVTLGVTVVSAMLMGISALKRQASFNTIQLMYSSFVVLVYYGITSTSISAISDDLVRLFSIFSAMVIGVMVLVLLQPTQLSQKR